ncbi:hypothetical protein SBRCBS47491_002079 [Sporothrix bragantina]|uniref:RING-type E3 ubiquitin transferase n=1 Tax=Sporothrix bragantina TaxID=671064 RepID=A0ABP0B3U8_9PEZI
MPQPHDNARFILLVMMILWINTSNDAGNGVLSAPSFIMARVNQQRASYEAVQTSQWGDFSPGPSNSTPINSSNHSGAGRWLNLTGFRAEDNLAWDDLDRFRARCLEWSRNVYPWGRDGVNLWDRGETMLTWQNATGSAAGFFVKRSASVERTAASYNMTTIMGPSFDWNGMPVVDRNRGTGLFGSGPRPVPVVVDPLTNRTMPASGSNDTTSDATSTLVARQLDTGTDVAAGAVAAAAGGQTAGKAAEAAPLAPDNSKAVPQFRQRPFPLQAIEWGRNITGDNGRMVVRVTDQDDEHTYVDDSSKDRDSLQTGGLVRTATASVTLEDVDGSGSAYDMRLHGVHWPRLGTLLLTTTSDKFGGIFALPHLAPALSLFASSQQLLNRTIDAALQKRETIRPFGPPDPALSTPLWSSNADGAPEGLTPLPRCEYVLYMQIHPVDASQFLKNQADYSADDMVRIMQGVEHEMRFPTGAPIFGSRGVPALEMSAVLYSPDCAYFIETKGPPAFAPIPEAGAAGEGAPLLHLQGKKAESFVYGARLWMLALGAVLFGQVQLFLSQVRETYTPSTLGRISFTTMAAMVLADGLVFSAASAWALTASASFLPSLVVTFAAFTSMTIGGYFLSEVYTAQEPERRRRDRQRLQQIQQREQVFRERMQQYYADMAARRAAAAGQTGQTGVAAAPPPAAAATAATAAARTASPPIIVPSDQDVDAEIAANMQAAATPLLPAPVTAAPAAGAPAATTTTGTTTTITLPPSAPFSNMAGRMVMIGIIIMFLSLAASTWWASLRTIYCNLLAFLYLSMWVPQIVRNIERNSRRAFGWRFLVGQSVLRLLPLAYFYLKQDNILYARKDWRSFSVLVGWVWLQLWVLAAQHELGPRFGIPNGWVPEAWEYHPVLREDNIEAGGLPIGLVSTATAAAGDEGPAGAAKRRSSGAGAAAGVPVVENHLPNTNIWTMDCAICCETLDVPVVRAGADDASGPKGSSSVSAVTGGVSGVLARRQYMVTPCRHIFHTNCLEGWLRFRLQCPICREELPPL